MRTVPYFRQFSWALYDFANTMFSMNIVSLHFALWVTHEKGGKDLYYSLAHAASVLAVMGLAPRLGFLADQKGKSRLLLIITTLISVAATILIGLFNQLSWGLLFFVLANIGYQLGLVFYDSLLPSIADEKDYGKISGIGVALGYVGAIAGIYLVNPWIYAQGQIFHSRAFIPTAFYFLIFSLPCFFLVAERTPQPAASAQPVKWNNPFEIRKKNPSIFFYLVAMFFLQDAATTVILFMSVYATEVGRFSQQDISFFLSISTLTAVISSYIYGLWVDRIGALKVFQMTIAVWIAGLLFTFFGQHRFALWIAGSFIGAGLGGLWTSSRPLLLSLIPKEESGSYFGLNVFAGRFSAILGPLTWGLIVWVLEPWGIVRYRLAILVLLLFAAVSGIFSRKIEMK